MSLTRNRTRTRLVAWVAALITSTAALVCSTPATQSWADTAPPDTSLPKTVSSDALPTVQVDGVVLTQVIVGNRVFAGGDFDFARPALAEPGVSQTARHSLLSYNLTTGVLDPSFAPELNGEVKALAVSADGQTLYVAGSFTEVGTTKRSRFAAFDVASGALTSFAPAPNYTVLGLFTSGTTLYLGGSFNNIKKKSTDTLVYDRVGAAAVDTVTGDILPFDPLANNGAVRQIIASPDRSKVILGGNFTTVNGSGSPGYGLAAVSASNGDSLPLPLNSLVRNAGDNAAIMSLAATPDGFYGSGYAFSKADGNLEGAFRATWDGDLTWVEDCHGDTYSVYPAAGAVYVAGHPHYCGNVGGFPQTSPTWTYHRALAFTPAATGVVGREQLGYFNFEGKPRPTLLNWFPDMDTGKRTGKTQGPWNVTGNDQYVLYAGEFLRVNGKKQQGLVRFAHPSSGAALNKDGPQVADGNFVPTIRPFAQGLRLSWPANWDRDNELLTYTVTRNGNTTTPVYTTTQRSTFWSRPNLSFIDTGVTPGVTYSYRLKVTDPYGNVRTGTSVSATATGGATLSTYDRAVLNNSPRSYWPLGETTGTNVDDLAGSDIATRGSGVTTGVPGAITGDGTAYRFNGAGTAFVAGGALTTGPDIFSAEAWFKTTSNRGGKILSFGSSKTGNSTSSDRQIYLSNAGRVYFGVRPGAVRTVNSTATFNNGQWHHVVATLSPQSMRLYVDGQLVGSRTDVMNAQIYDGYWRIGGDTMSGWTDNPTSGFLAGDIDQAAVYPDALSAATVEAHYALRSGPPANVAPTASFTSAANNLALSVNGSGSSDSDGTITSYAWTFGDGGTATGANASHTYTSAGVYPVKLTVTDNEGATGSVTRSVTVSSAPVDTPFVSDGFERTVASGLGTADVGGVWTTSSSSGFAVNGGAGIAKSTTAGTTRTAYLGSTLRDSTDATLTFSSDKAATGGGISLTVSGRRVSTTEDYRAEVKISNAGKLTLSLPALQGSSTAVPLANPVTLAGTVTAGDQVHVRLQVFGTNPTTVRAKVWVGSAAEPSAWTATGSSSYAGLQRTGAVGFITYLSSSATNAPVNVSILKLEAKPVIP
ncbi:MAG: LamG-like jellyroll fold domain-containing protein [Propionibacteriaceae bacterium]